eukprot:1160773-Pelagomonas_calceolata.AAC.3
MPWRWHAVPLPLPAQRAPPVLACTQESTFIATNVAAPTQVLLHPLVHRHVCTHSDAAAPLLAQAWLRSFTHYCTCPGMRASSHTPSHRRCSRGVPAPDSLRHCYSHSSTGVVALIRALVHTHQAQVLQAVTHPVRHCCRGVLVPDPGCSPSYNPLHEAHLSRQFPYVCVQARMPKSAYRQS